MEWNRIINHNTNIIEEYKLREDFKFNNIKDSLYNIIECNRIIIERNHNIRDKLYNIIR